MILPDVLKTVHRLGFDTAPLIYFVEQHPDYFDRLIRETFRELA
jgi:hypothetical protein